MPISSIIQQPATKSLNAAYRPVIINAQVAKVSGNLPPVVFCDVYFNNIFYKSFSKTLPKTEDVTYGYYEFDIQDACQEYLKKALPPIGVVNVYHLPVGILETVFCRLRSSATDSNGLIVLDGTAPVQATGKNNSISGGGLQTNSFYVLNSTLQHEDNQDFEAHLSSFKKRIWSSDAFPLSHRPEHYRICNGDHDMFPIVYKRDNEDIPCLRLKYRKKGQTTWQTASLCSCVAPTGSIVGPEEWGIGVPFQLAIPINGTPPFTISVTLLPSWMSISISDNNIVLSGTPDTLDEYNVVMKVENECGQVNLTYTLDIVSCMGPFVKINAMPETHSISEGPQFGYLLELSGTEPISIVSHTIPEWMDIDGSGPDWHIEGEPETPGIYHYEINFENSCGSLTVEGDIEILS
ncbi:MAG: hypothetical protein IPQ08_15475 [Chitinophagaceae bacterium]|nr:hypothetical protein [Chitinophagaceae bacterium]